MSFSSDDWEALVSSDEESANMTPAEKKARDQQ